MRVVLTGGGTGGHVVPNFAVIEELKTKAPDSQFLYVGSKKGVEKKMVKDFGLEFQGVTCGKLRRYFSWENFLDFLKVPVGVFQAFKVLRKFKPGVIFSKGGYVSVPVVIAGWLLKIPIICHESDVNPGLANKICFKFARKILLSFEESKKYVRGKVVGNPVRNLKGNAGRGYKFTGFEREKPVLLVMGGSQGAREINDLVDEKLDQLLGKWQIVHIRGKGNLSGKSVQGYREYEYLGEELFDIYFVAEVVVTRGGANSLAELAYLKKKALIIPLGFEASRGDQVENAEVFSKRYGWKIYQGGDLLEQIEEVSKIDNNFNFENGTERIVQEIIDAANENRS